MGFQCSESLILNRKHTKVNYESRQVTDFFCEKKEGGDFVESLAHNWMFEALQGACVIEDLKSPRCFHNELWLLSLGRHCSFLPKYCFTSCSLIVWIYIESTNWDIHNKHVIIFLVFLKSYITEYLGIKFKVASYFNILTE